MAAELQSPLGAPPGAPCDIRPAGPGGRWPGATALAVMFRVLLRSVMVMIGGVQRMAVRHFRMMRGFLVMPGLVMLCRLAMMLRRFLMVMRGFLMMLVDVVVHDALLGCGCGNIAGQDETFATRILQTRNRRRHVL